MFTQTSVKETDDRYCRLLDVQRDPSMRFKGHTFVGSEASSKRTVQRRGGGVQGWAGMGRRTIRLTKRSLVEDKA